MVNKFLTDPARFLSQRRKLCGALVPQPLPHRLVNLVRRVVEARLNKFCSIELNV